MRLWCYHFHSARSTFQAWRETLRRVPPSLEKTPETPTARTLTSGNDRALPSIIKLSFSALNYSALTPLTSTPRAARSLLEGNAPSFPPKLEKTTETPILTTLTYGNDRALPSIIKLSCSAFNYSALTPLTSTPRAARCHSHYARSAFTTTCSHSA